MSLTTMGAGGGARWFAGAAVAIDFASGWSLDGSAPSSLLTTTRASTAWAPDAAGIYTSFTSNAPRITDLGLLTEEARTNSIRNNSMQGAVAGTPGTLPTNWGLNGTANGLTREIVGVGTENGVDYIDVRWFGTASAQIDIAIRPEATTTQVAAASGQSWTASAFFKLVTGANPFSITNFYVLGINSGGSATADTAVTSVTLNGTLTRRSVSITMADATTAAALFTTIFRIPNGTVCDFTLRIGWPQLELGAFATSPIRTTSAAATRAADGVNLTTTPGYTDTYTSFIDTTLSDLSTTRNILAGTTSQRLAYATTGGGAGGGLVFNGTASVTATAGTGTWLTGGRLAFGASAAGRSVSFNNGPIATDANTQSFPTTLYIGGSAGAPYGAILTRRLTLWSTRLPDAQLQAMTA